MVFVSEMILEDFLRCMAWLMEFLISISVIGNGGGLLNARLYVSVE